MQQYTMLINVCKGLQSQALEHRWCDMQAATLSGCIDSCLSVLKVLKLVMTQTSHTYSTCLRQNCLHDNQRWTVVQIMYFGKESKEDKIKFLDPIRTLPVISVSPLPHCMAQCLRLKRSARLPCYLSACLLQTTEQCIVIS